MTDLPLGARPLGAARIGRPARPARRRDRAGGGPAGGSSARSWWSSRSRWSRPIGYAIYLSLFREQLIGGNSFVGVRQLPAGADRPAVLGRRSAESRSSSLVQVPIMLDPRAARRARARQRPAATGAASSGSRSSCRTRCPAVVGVADVGLHLRLAVRPGRQAQQRCSARRPARPARPAAGCSRSIGNIVTWEFVGYNMLIFYAALRSVPGDLYEAAEIDGAGPFRIIRSIKLPALRGAIVIATIFSIIGSFQLFNEPNILHCARAERDHHLLHAQHVRLQPVVLRPAVQLLGHGRDRHGRLTMLIAVRRAAARLAGGWHDRDHDGDAGQRRRRSPRPAGGPHGHAAQAARKPNASDGRRGRKSVARSPSLHGDGDRCSTPCCRWSGWSSTPPRPRAALFSTFGLWFGGPFALCPNIHQTLTYDDGIFVRWLGTRCSTSSSAPAGPPSSPRWPATGWRSSTSPAGGRVFAVVLGAVAVPGTALAVPDLPDVQPTCDLTNTPWAVIIPSLVSPFGLYLIWVYAQDAVPDRTARGGPDRRRRRVPHVLHRSRSGCSPPASSRCCCSPWWPPGTTTSCR